MSLQTSSQYCNHRQYVMMILQFTAKMGRKRKMSTPRVFPYQVWSDVCWKDKSGLAGNEVWPKVAMAFTEYDFVDKDSFDALFDKITVDRLIIGRYLTFSPMI